jgi:hypothetical protein
VACQVALKRSPPWYIQRNPIGFFFSDSDLMLSPVELKNATK